MEIKKLKVVQVSEFCKALLEYYQNLLDDNDLANIFYAAKNVQEENVLEMENLLMSIAGKVWEYDLNSGEYIIISWNKYATLKDKGPITFATISKRDEIISFCGMTSGIEYEISYQALIGALPKDGATLIEDIPRKNEYTIGMIGDKVINSYNGATKLITPMQLVSDRTNEYRSKHNELILNSSLIKEVGIYELDEIKRGA